MDWRDTLPKSIQRSYADNQADESAAWLSLAVNQGIVDVRIHPFDDDSFPFELLTLSREEHDRNDESERHPDLTTESTSRKHQELVLPLATDPDVTLHWAIELSRIIIPWGSIGFLDSLEQVLRDIDGNYYPTSVDYWGSPYFDINDVANCRWYLKTQSLDSFDGARVDFTRPAAIDPLRDLPGAPYSEKFEIDAIWYPAHASCGNDLNWLIPQQTVLRFYMVTPPTTIYRWQAAGRMRAFSQSTFCLEAAENARKIY